MLSKISSVGISLQAGTAVVVEVEVGGGTIGMAMGARISRRVAGARARSTSLRRSTGTLVPGWTVTEAVFFTLPAPSKYVTSAVHTTPNAGGRTPGFKRLSRAV